MRVACATRQAVSSKCSTNNRTRAADGEGPKPRSLLVRGLRINGLRNQGGDTIDLAVSSGARRPAGAAFGEGSPRVVCVTGRWRRRRVGGGRKHVSVGRVDRSRRWRLRRTLALVVQGMFGGKGDRTPKTLCWSETFRQARSDLCTSERKRAS